MSSEIKPYDCGCNYLPQQIFIASKKKMYIPLSFFHYKYLYIILEPHVRIL